jgi:hypothetical protein
MSRLVIAALTLLCVMPATAGAQGRVAIGLRFGVDELAEALSVGAELLIPVSGRLAVRPSVDLFAVEYGSYRAYNLDLEYAVTPALYVGGGVASRWLSAGDAHGDVLGGNLFAGVLIPGGRVRPFAEVRAFVKHGFHGAGIFGMSVEL